MKINPIGILIGLLLLSHGCVENPAPNTTEQVTNQPEKPLEEKPIESKKQWPKIVEPVPYLKAYGEENRETVVLMHTRLGDVKFKLYKDTPIHRANFIHNIKYGLFERSIFYRVVPDFMIQGGNSDHDETLENREQVAFFTLPTERTNHHFHKRGALAMAMSYINNPENNSAQYSFYVVIGKPMTDAELDATEREYDIEIDETKREVYRKAGGTPHLDARHTVFGEVIEGMEIVEAISREPRDSGDWPVEDVEMEFEVIE